jgi:ribosomal protein S18 acetylase RimI-like enzyme
MTPTATYSPAAVTVRKATSTDAPALARVLAEAFLDDPAGKWFVPREQTRLAELERFFRIVSVERAALPHGEVLTTPGVSGTALWMPPGSMEAGKLEELIFLAHVARAARGNTRRVLRGLTAMDAVHPHEPHWYLPLLGVSPARQGQGIGSALLRPVLERCDADGMPAYLEATSPRNRELYERHGFEVREVTHLPDDGPPLWCMWREPQAG